MRNTVDTDEPSHLDPECLQIQLLLCFGTLRINFTKFTWNKKRQQDIHTNTN